MGLSRIVLAVLVVLWTILGPAVSAQQPVRRLGYLGSGPAPPPGTPQHAFEAFRQALADLSYEEGQNLVIEARWPEGGRADRLPEAAAALTGLQVEVICAVGGLAARAVKNATTTIPVVFAIVIDLVAVGLVAQMRPPGGNLTGFTTFDPQQASKQLHVLREALPQLSRLALLGDQAVGPALFEANEQAARTLGLHVQTLKVGAPNPDLEGALQAAVGAGAEALVVLDHPVTAAQRRQIAALAVTHRPPTLFARDHADAGGLLAYGTGLSEATRRAAAYVDHLLRGAKPGDLPVEVVIHPELIINRKTAQEIGVTIPEEVLQRAHQVLQ